MSTAVLSLGSNIGDRLEHLRSAVKALAPWLRTVSPVFSTPPWGPVTQADYLNAVVIADDPAATPADWLARARACEAAAGRVRELRWGPRTLDVDVISVDDVISDDPELTLPHPRAAQRAFVLLPWWSADPEAMLVGHGSVMQLITELPEGERDALRLLPGVELRA